MSAFADLLRSTVRRTAVAPTPPTLRSSKGTAAPRSSTPPSQHSDDYMTRKGIPQSEHTVSSLSQLVSALSDYAPISRLYLTVFWFEVLTVSQ
jgi:hypothetical protein